MGVSSTQIFCSNFFSSCSLNQRRSTQENGAAATPAYQARLLAEMRPGAGDDGLGADAARAALAGGPVDGELLTPTGAAIITCLAQSFSNRPEMVIDKTGYGAGMREIQSRPNLLRITVGRGRDGDNSDSTCHDRVTMVESWIDDMNPEIFGYLMEILFVDGALDVVWTPVFMKKNRPGTLVQVLCRTDHRERIIQRILNETTSLGVRFYEMERCLLSRESVTLQTQFGEVKGKKIRSPGGETRMVPEFEDCRTLALEKGIPIRKAYEQIQKALDQG